MYMSLPLYNCKGFDLGHTTEWSSGFPYFLQFKSEFGRSSHLHSGPNTTVVEKGTGAGGGCAEVGSLKSLIPAGEDNAWFGKAPHSFTHLSPHLTFQLITVLEIQGNIF